VRKGTIRLGEAYQSLVRPPPHFAISAESVRTHQLVPGDVRDAPALEAVLRQVDVRLEDGVLLVHQAAMDVDFLRRAHAATGRRWRKPRVVDTVDLLVRVARRALLIDPAAPDRLPNLNLSAARRRFGLPEYGAHDALTDAIATAELFLVLRRALAAKTLREL
jgi:DNA polymerase-3 subunit epsilon